MIDTNQLQEVGATGEASELSVVLPHIVPASHFAAIAGEPTEPPPVSFAESILTADALHAKEVKEVESFVGSWLRSETHGILYGERGKGKTWMALELAMCLAEGRNCGPWPIPKACRVLYVDGEMPLYTLRLRTQLLGKSKGAPLFLLSHKEHSDRTNEGINLTLPDAQKDLMQICEEREIEVLILDNLSCLFYGMDENKAEDWEAVLPWLLALQRKGIATVIVHHAGREGKNPRGTSKREDAASFVLCVETLDDEEAQDNVKKTKFTTRFTKERGGSSKDAGPWEWSFETPAEGGRTIVRWGLFGDLERFKRCVESGLELCSEIAKETGFSESKVSRLAKRAESQKVISITGTGNQRRYIYTVHPQFT